MKLKKSGQILLALAVSLGLSFGLTSCFTSYTVGYLYITGAQYNQIGGFKITNTTGHLTPIRGLPMGSGGSNPIRMAVSASGRYLYVLNSGTPGTPDANGNFTYTSASITVFSVGGDGTLAPQQTYTSQGYGSIRMAMSISGGFLYVLDEYAPSAGQDSSGNPLISSSTLQPGMSCRDTSGLYHPTGDVTVFAVDENTGRLSLITNNQLQTPTGAQLTYFPVGCQPIDFKVTGGYVLTADTDDPVTGNRFTVFPYAVNNTSGQLTTTQNSEFVTGAASISAIGSDFATKYIYILDPVSNEIWYYTVGQQGLLQAVTTSPTSNSSTHAGGPIQLTSDSKSQFLYVANAGPSGISKPNSDITGYNISPNGALAAITPQSEWETGSSPQCILEDPSNQWIYTADHDTNTVTGHAFDPASGALSNLHGPTTFPTVGNPTFCVADSHTD